ncbi:MAG: VWA domain-containing protein [Polyangiaceae bacterium]|nr:VWA domain-containing protein [Polyangiaceae bacterium]
MNRGAVGFVATACLALSMLASTGCVVRVRTRLTATGHIEPTITSWKSISSATGGITLQSKGSADMPTLIIQTVHKSVPKDKPVDLVFVVDTTGSMQDDIDSVRKKMKQITLELSKRNPSYRVGVNAYRDKGDDYVAKTYLKLSEDEDAIFKAMNKLKADGGGDVREHVYAGLDTALREQPWRNGVSHHIILIGDAPPHDDYKKDKRNYDSIVSLSRKEEVKINTIGVYCNKICQGAIASGL